MIIGSQSISNQSENFNDYRYQKALKQISKLINVNRQVKVESQKLRYQIQESHQRNQELLEINSKLQKELQSLRNQVRNINNSYIELQNYCKTVEFQQKQHLRNNEKQTLNRMAAEKAHQEEIKKIEEEFNQQLNQINIEMLQKDKKIMELQQKTQFVCELQAENNKLHEQYELTLRQNQQFHIKMGELSDQLINVSTKIKQQTHEDLINKLKINQEWIKSLNQENYNLKQKMLQQEYKKQKEKCNQTIFQNMKNIKSYMNINTGSANTNEILFKEYASKVQKKIKKIEDQKLKIQTKYVKLKQKFSQVQLRKKQLQRQVNLLTVKLSGYEQLTERQQKELQKMIVQFNKQMQRVLKKKQKIQSASKILEPISPTKTINKEIELKRIIDNLETQITQNKAQAQQKDKLIQFLQMKIQALQREQFELQQTNEDLQEQLSSFRDYDLSKTSKNASSKGQVLLKTQPLAKNGGKVFIINGKKYETRLLKDKDNSTLEDTSQKIPQVNQVQKKILFPSSQISYVSTQRNYSNLNHINTAQRA